MLGDVSEPGTSGAPADTDHQCLAGHLAEFGLVAPLGVPSVQKLWEVLTENEDILPAPAVSAVHCLGSRSSEVNRMCRRWPARIVIVGSRFRTVRVPFQLY